MIVISQLLQVLQASETVPGQPTGSGADHPSGGLAKVFGAILEQARSVLWNQAVRPEGLTIPLTSPMTGVQVATPDESAEGLEPDFEGLPIAHAASVLAALDKFEVLPIEHAASVLEALSARAEAALAGDGHDTVAEVSETDAGVLEESIANASIVIDDAVDGLLAALSAVPVQLAPDSSALRSAPAPPAAPQPGDAAPEAASKPFQLKWEQLMSQLDATNRPASLGPPGIPPGFGLLRAAIVKSVTHGDQAGPAQGQRVQSSTRVTPVIAESPTLSEAFVKAVRRAQPQAQPKQGGGSAVAAPPVLGSPEALLPAVKPEAVPAQMLASPGATEAVQGNHVPKSNATAPQSMPERSAPEIVHVREVGDFTVKTLRYLAGRNEEIVTVRLVPRSLGELQIAVRSAGQSLEIVMTVASHAARDAIEAQLSGLREMFARDGLDVAKVTVQIFTAGDQAPGHFASGHSAASGHAARTPMKFTGEPSEAEADPRASPQGSAGHEGSLNMFV